MSDTLNTAIQVKEELPHMLLSHHTVAQRLPREHMLKNIIFIKLYS